jgi:type VI secretion system ImpM family protein
LFNKNSEEIVSGYFGKLPEFNDFVKFNAGSPGILFIDNWIQEGLAQAKSKFKSEWKVKYDSLPPTGFFLPVPSSDKITAGMLYAGKDKSGREFPFIIYSLISGKIFDPFYLMPAEIEEILTELDKILRNEENLNSLNTALKNFTLSVPQKDMIYSSIEQYISGSRINEFITRTGFNNFEEISRDIEYRDNSFIKIIFNSDEPHFSNDAGLIIRLLSKKINLSFKHSSVFWNNNQGGIYQIIIFPSKLTAVNFIDLLSIDSKDGREIQIKSSLVETGIRGK